MKGTCVSLTAMLAGASAFAPAAPMRSAAVARSSGMTMQAAKSAAIPFMPQPPALDGSMVGDVGFDPLNLSNWDVDFSKFIVPEAASMRADAPGINTLYWMREAELKHGRVAMLAVIGWIAVDLGLRFPGARYEGLSGVTAHDAMVASGNMTVMLLFFFLVEMIGGAAIFSAANGSGRAAGDFGIDPLGLLNNEKKKARYELNELKHGRLAMLAFSGIATQSVLTGHDFPYMY